MSMNDQENPKNVEPRTANNMPGANRFAGTRTRLVCGLVLVVCWFLPPTTAIADEWHFSDVERIVAIGDVHGAYDALVTTLQEAGVIDKNLAWSGGKTHLVSTGDLVDRGAESRRVMDLMMRLEQEAPLAGGRVHQLLGNHEVMNLIGDLRYVVDEEYAAFRDIESTEERERWYQRFRHGKPDWSNEVSLRRDFDKLAPPGYFGHRGAFRSNGYYGKWLLTKPFMIVINDIAFVHGGAPAFVGEQGLAGINGSLKGDLEGYVQAFEALVDEGVLTPWDSFRKTPKALARLLDAGTLQPAVAATAQQLIDFSESPLHKPAGPTWYRGSAMCNRFVESRQLDAVLQKVDASRLVIGHTTTSTRQVQQRFGGRVFEIDTGMLSHVYGGSGNALVFEGGKASVVTESGRRRVAPVEHPFKVGLGDAPLTEDDLAKMLETGHILDVLAEGAEWKLVQVTDGKLAVLATFRTLPGKSRFAPEFAAYRLDRQLQLGMVPVTVRRTIDGRRGTLQFLPGVTLTERERVAAGEGAAAICPVEEQIDAMLVFDALIHNVVRSPSAMVYDREDWSLMLVDHNAAFATDGDLPPDIVDVGLAVGDEWRAALQALDDKTLRAELGNVLDKTRLQALMQRRDALLSLSSR